MNYKETFRFVAICLTISLENKNRQIIEKRLQSDKVDWDAVVKFSTAHYVFPALYCNLKRADFLQYLPSELVTYMEHITSLNRERNQQIIAQAKELNILLLANNITPIFLKGTGNLLAGLYEDVAERMVGDIDFIFSKEAYPKAIKFLINNGYFSVDPSAIFIPHFKRHYSRLKTDNKIAAVEIHSQLLIAKYAKKFNYHFVEKDSQVINDITVLSYANKLSLSIIAHQINDNGFYYKTLALRNAYDVFLLSKKTNTKVAINLLDKLIPPLNCFLAVCNEVFNNVDSIVYFETVKTKKYLTTFKNYLSNSKRRKKHYFRVKKCLFMKSILITFFRLIFYNNYRSAVLKKIRNKY